MSELWVCHESVSSWKDKNLWLDFFSSAEKILGYSLTHLDVNDPIRKKVDTTNFKNIGDYITSFEGKSNNREIFGEFKEIDITLGIYHERRFDPNGFGNSFHWYIPENFIASKDGIYKVRSLFDLGNKMLAPFYSYCDFIDEAIKKKRKPTGAVNIERELIGIFWLTYFNRKYVQFYGTEKLGSIASYAKNTDVNGGVEIRLTDTPFNCSDEIRLCAEKFIGQQFFVDPSSYEIKPEGVFAIKFSDLIELDRISYDSFGNVTSENNPR